MTMRLPEDEKKYQDAKAAGDLRQINLEPSVREFKFWRIVKNRFIHSRAVDKDGVNDMLVLKRRGPKKLTELFPYEWDEVAEILDELEGSGYNVALKNFDNMSSVKDIPHFHLYVLKKEFRE